MKKNVAYILEIKVAKVEPEIKTQIMEPLKQDKK
jgi:hypothetical protein